MTDDTVNATLVPIAAELVGVVRDYGPDDVAAVLARVPDGRHDALAVVLAAMVDPDKRPSQLLAWTKHMAESSDKSEREKVPAHLTVAQVNAVSDGRRPERRAEIARLTLAGYSTTQIAERVGISTRAVVRNRAAIRKVLEAAS
jgi:DNA-directed RNA polymerase specialized sigma24 family protein